MQTDLFVQWFHHFLKYTKPTKEDPVLLVLDDHFSHTKNIEFINLAREHYVMVICIPPHCSHKMQPLDVTFMGPLNTFYMKAIEKWLRNNPGRVVTQFQVGRLFEEAYLRVSTPENPINGFRKCGIESLEADIFKEEDFVAAEVTEIPFSPNVAPSSARLVHLVQPVENADPMQSNGNVGTPIRDQQPSTSFAVSPKDIVPVPRVATAGNRKRNGRKKGSAEILTANPYKNELQTAKAEKDAKEANKAEKRKTAEEKKKGVSDGKQRKANPRKLFDDDSDDQEDTNDGKKNIRYRKTNTDRVLFHNNNDDQDDTECLYCNEHFLASKSHEEWIQCQMCSLWAHELCAGVEENSSSFIYENSN